MDCDAIFDDARDDVASDAEVYVNSIEENSILQQVVDEHKEDERVEVVQGEVILEEVALCNIASIAGPDCTLYADNDKDDGMYDNIEVITLSSEPWYCPYRPCNLTFLDCDSLTRHILQAHITRVYKCDHCDRLFHNDTERDFHDMCCSDQDNISDLLPILCNDTTTNKLTIKLHQCAQCQKTFGRKHHLVRHLKTHSRPYKCVDCDTSYVSAGALKIHKLSHNDEKPHVCIECGKTYRDPLHLAEHSLSHLTQNPFQCPHCSVKYATRGPLRLHVFYKHFDGLNDCHYYTCPSTQRKLYLTKADADRFACPHCAKGFARRSDVKKHDLTRCMLMNTLKCKHCNRKFSDKASRKSHSLECKKYNSATGVTHRSMFAHRCPICSRRFFQHFQLTRHMLLHTKPYACSICNKRFITINSCKTHMLIHISEKPYSCNVCKRKYRTSGQLSQHKQTHNASSFPCLYCEKKYSKCAPLRWHVFYKHLNGHEQLLYYTCPESGKGFYLTAEDASKYVCNTCKKPFYRHSELLAHYRDTHSSNPRPFRCTQCGAGFPNKTRLGLHVKSHSNSRDFQCAECGVKCTTKSSLTSHMVVHKSERPFACVYCDKAFARYIQLKRHMLTHTGERSHQCEVCGKMFPTASDVKKHLVVHQPLRARPFACEYCSKSFTKKTYLETHIKNHKLNTAINITSQELPMIQTIQ